MDKTLAEMTPEERKAAINRAVAEWEAWLERNADAIGEVLASETH